MSNSTSSNYELLAGINLGAPQIINGKPIVDRNPFAPRPSDAVTSDKSITITSISFQANGGGTHDILITSPDKENNTLGRIEGFLVGQIMRDYDGYFIYIQDDINGKEMTRSISSDGMHIRTCLKETKKIARKMILDAVGQTESSLDPELSAIWCSI